MNKTVSDFELLATAANYIKSIGSDAKAGGKTGQPEGGGERIGSEYPAGETLVEGLSPGWGERIGVEAARTDEQQPSGGGDAAQGAGPI